MSVAKGDEYIIMFMGSASLGHRVQNSSSFLPPPMECEVWKMLSANGLVRIYSWHDLHRTLPTLLLIWSLLIFNNWLFYND